MPVDKQGHVMSVDGVSYWDGKRWKQSPDARERVRRAQAFVDRANQEPYNRVALYEAALNHHSHNLTALDGLIEAYSDSSRPHDVAELCRRYLQVAWSDTVVRHLAFAYAELGQWEDAIAAATRLLEASDAVLIRVSAAYIASVGYRAIGDIESARAILGLVDVSNLPVNEFLRLFVLQRAIVKYRTGDKESALADLDWIDSAWPTASGVAGIRRLIESNELLDAAARPPAVPGAPCRVCGAPPKSVASVMCAYCSSRL